MSTSMSNPCQFASLTTYACWVLLGDAIHIHTPYGAGKLLFSTLFPQVCAWKDMPALAH